MRWQIRHTDRTDKRFRQAGNAARLLYEDAGAWAMQQVFNKPGQLPETWFIPSEMVQEWGGKNLAAKLVAVGLWQRARREGRAGYIYPLETLAYENTPAYIESKREKYRREHERKARARTPSKVDGIVGTTYK